MLLLQCGDGRCVMEVQQCQCNSTTECEEELDMQTVKPVTVSYTFPPQQNYTLEVIFISNDNEVGNFSFSLLRF